MPSELLPAKSNADQPPLNVRLRQLLQPRCNGEKGHFHVLSAAAELGLSNLKVYAQPEDCQHLGTRHRPPYNTLHSART